MKVSRHLHASMSTVSVLRLCPLLPALAALASPATAAPWGCDLDAAMAQAAAEGKLVLVEFTGSDWCSYCIKLNRELLNTPAFAEYIAPHFVPVQIDVPIRRDFDRQLLERNKEICKRYRVPGYPTLMVITPQGQVVGGFRGDPGNGMEGAKRHLDAAQKFAHLLELAETQQGEEKLRTLHLVYSGQQACMRPCTGLRERIAALDSKNITGIHNELQVEEQREQFRRELAATRGNPQAALALIESRLATAAPQNHEEMMQARVTVMLAAAKTEADVLAVKQLMLELADEEGDSAARSRAIIEQRFANPAQVLEHIRQNPIIW